MEAVTGIILAGGAARRMGGQDKGLLLFQQQPLFIHVARKLAPQVTTLQISANRHLDIYQQSGYRCISDSLEGFQGPLAGMLSALMVVETEWVVFSACDSPCLPSDFVSKLWQQKREASVCWIRTAERDHPVFCLMHRRLCEPLAKYLTTGERRVMTFLRQYGHAVAVDYPEQAFLNINTPQELLYYQKMIDNECSE